MYRWISFDDAMACVIGGREIVEPCKNKLYTFCNYISLPWWYIFEIIASNICLYNNTCEMLTRCEFTCILAAAATCKIKLELPI